MLESTPMMKQYLSIKKDHRDAVLFFRLGDFYEMFNEDAIEISNLLNLTLTHRGKNPMCGIPHHAARVYIARLLRAGKKIAICEQVSLPGPGKGIVERKVVEIITPGTAIEDEYLDRTENNYLACLSHSHSPKETFGFSYIDITTGEFAATSFFKNEYEERFRKELGRVHPREILIQQSVLDTSPGISSILSDYSSMVVNRYPDWSFNQEAGYKRMCSVFGTASLNAFGLSENSPEIPAAALLLEYLENTAFSSIAHVSTISIYGESDFVSIDDSTRKNLELVQNLRDGTPSYTLFEVLNNTKTAMGTRLLRSWIHHPLTTIEAIQERTTLVDQLYRSQKLLSRIRDHLSTVLDVERLVGRVAMERAHGKDLIALKQSLDSFLKIDSFFQTEEILRLTISDTDRETIKSVFSLIDESVQENCPTVFNEAGLIKDSWSPKLDELRSLRDNSHEVLEKYLTNERESTGIQNLKIRYNRMNGYFIEVSKGNISSVPDYFIRRRSLSNADRFTTERLIELETQLNNVHSTIIECEQELFFDVRKRVFSHLKILSFIATLIAKIDVLQSFAHAATLNAWVAPKFIQNGTMDIQEGRHPVVESHLPPGEFIPNSLTLSSDIHESLPTFALITGPNMAGKSTFLRQTALIMIMAQIGSFVSANSATITPVDRIYCRVGATDNLARGESTFLVEMTETAHILRTATQNSLVIMDEVGRGTSTGDGLSIARAVTEYVLEHIGSKTLFATHYHELALLIHTRLANYCLDVNESEGKIVFLKKVRPGASESSYGIHVARLAGIPETVLKRAALYLSNIESTGLSLYNTEKESVALNKPPQLFPEEELVINELLSLDINKVTPLEALHYLDSWKKKLYPS